MAFIPRPPEEYEEKFDLRRVVEEYLRERQEARQERRYDWFYQQWRRRVEERVAQHIPPHIRDAIRQLREAGRLPAQVEPVPVDGFVGAIREALADIGFLIIFLVFVLIGSIYLGERAMFYILSLILLSILVVNAHKLRRMFELFF